MKLDKYAPEIINRHKQIKNELNQHKKNVLEFKNMLPDNMPDNDFIEMFAMHIFLKPVLLVLFNNIECLKRCEVFNVLEDALNVVSIKEQHLDFYDFIKEQSGEYATFADKQSLINDLFNELIKILYSKDQEKLGVVYTPVEIVDFMNHSVNDILKKEFNCTLSDNVQIVATFADSGIFLTRMMLDDTLITNDVVENKINHDMRGFEIMPLSYYISSINLEFARAERQQQSTEPHHSIILTDTFEHTEDVFEHYYR